MRVERQVLFWLAALAVLLLLIGLLRDILLPFVAGLVLAYFLNPAADWLERLGLPRVWASILIVALGAIMVITVMVLLVPLLASQAQQFALALPGEFERIRTLLETWARERLGARFPEFEEGVRRATGAAGDNWANLAGWAASSLWSRSLAVFNFFSLLLITPLVVFYLLIDWNAMLLKLDGWLPRAHAPVIRLLAGDINDAVSAFIRGQGMVCVILGAFYALALTAVGLRYGLLIGLFTGALSFVPFVGWALGLITSTALAVIQFWPDTTPILIVIGIFLTGQALDAAWLSPKIVGSKIGLHPVWLIFALFVFSYLFGFVGVLVAVPVAAATGVIVRFALSLYLKSPVYHGESMPPGGEPSRADRT
ncbi:MAG: AI-2E family transporter [Hyphomicrobium sp.]